MVWVLFNHFHSIFIVCLHVSLQVAFLCTSKTTHFAFVRHLTSVNHIVSPQLANSCGRIVTFQTLDHLFVLSFWPRGTICMLHLMPFEFAQKRCRIFAFQAFVRVLFNFLYSIVNHIVSPQLTDRYGWKVTLWTLNPFFVLSFWLHGIIFSVHVNDVAFKICGLSARIFTQVAFVGHFWINHALVIQQSFGKWNIMIITNMAKRGKKQNESESDGAWYLLSHAKCKHKFELHNEILCPNIDILEYKAVQVNMEEEKNL